MRKALKAGFVGAVSTNLLTHQKNALDTQTGTLSRAHKVAETVSQGVDVSTQLAATSCAYWVEGTDENKALT